mgnify:CR=1 FL=1
MKVIQGKKNMEVPRWAYYREALNRFCQGNKQKTYQEMKEDGSLVKFVFLNVKAIPGIQGNRKNYTRESIESDFMLNSIVLQSIGMFTPEQLMQYFPPERSYDGKKCGCKDCFTSLKAIAKLEKDKPIGDEDKVVKLLWDYHNWDLDEFMVEWMMTVSRMRQLDGRPGVMEEFLQKQGVDTYTYHEQEGYMQNNRTGEVTKIFKPKKRVPKYIKVHNKTTE